MRSGRGKEKRLTGGLGDLVVIGPLQLGRDADKRLSESVLGSGVDHLGLDLGSIRGPARPEQGDRLREASVHVLGSVNPR
jgi:hypothetical protein